MKSLKILFLIALGACIMTPNLSAENSGKGDYLDEPPLMIGANQKNVYVGIENRNTEDVSILIEDKNKAIVHRENAKVTGKFAQKFNLSRLDDGDYTVIVTRRTTETLQPFAIQNGIVKMSPAERVTNCLPVVHIQEGKIDVNYYTPNTTSNLSMEIYNIEGERVYLDNQKVNVSFHKRYSLDELPKSKYIVYLQTAKGAYSFKVDLKSKADLNKDVALVRNR